MPTDYAAIMLEIQKKLIDFYTNNSFPDGNNKSTQFEIAVFEASKEVVATYDRNNGLPQDYHTVEYLGGNIFPDIIIHIGATDQKVGMEVKYHSSSNDWKTKGNSTYGTTQVDGLCEIYIVFGKFVHNTCDIRIRPYGECISGISITHRPRYDIDMDSSVDFCSDELGVSYGELCQLTPEQRKIHINTYIAKTKYTTLSSVEADRKKLLISQALVLFPEIFSRNPRRRYNNFSVWLFANNVICKNVRDFLTAGGQDEISGITVPKVFVMLYNHIECVKNEIEHIPPQVLARAWYGSVSEVGNIPTDTPGRLRCWLALAINHHGDETSTIKGTNLNFKRTLLNWLGLE